MYVCMYVCVIFLLEILLIVSICDVGYSMGILYEGYIPIDIQ